RFREDALRIMRGLRFAAQTGFEIEEKTFRAMVESAPLLKKISGERIASELNSLVTAPYASSVIRRSVKILSVIIPELALCEKFDQKSRYHDRDVLEHILSTLDGIPVDKTLRTRDLSLALAALLHDIAKPNCFYIGPSGSGHMKGHPAQSAVIADRVLSELHYSTNIRNEVVRLVRYHNYFIPVQNYSVHRFMCNCGPGFVRRLFILQRADIMAHSPTGQKSVWRIAGMEEVSDGLLAKGVVYSVTDLKISGADLIEMGVEPGPGLGRILDDVFDAYLWGEVPNDHTELLEYVHRVIGNGSR
ncbi:MAG: HD domain-containing protein, partial [Clostridiales bacterium]|nr:HD domain-containing protein [Clostridiales bacterium]